jgi:hypothetical protein
MKSVISRLNARSGARCTICRCVASAECRRHREKTRRGAGVQCRITLLLVKTNLRVAHSYNAGGQRPTLAACAPARPYPSTYTRKTRLGCVSFLAALSTPSLPPPLARPRTPSELNAVLWASACFSSSIIHHHGPPRVLLPCVPTKPTHDPLMEHPGPESRWGYHRRMDRGLQNTERSRDGRHTPAHRPCRRRQRTQRRVVVRHLVIALHIDLPTKTRRGRSHRSILQIRAYRALTTDACLFSPPPRI